MYDSFLKVMHEYKHDMTDIKSDRMIERMDQVNIFNQSKLLILLICRKFGQQCPGSHLSWRY